MFARRFGRFMSGFRAGSFCSSSSSLGSFWGEWVLRVKWQTRKLGWLIAWLIMCVLISVIFVPIGFAVGVDEAGSAINRAEQNLGSVYVVVAAASASGADVTAELSKLREAGDFLSKALSEFEAGDYEKALQAATACTNIVEELSSDAQRSRIEAEKANGDRILSTAVVSGFGLVVFFVLSFLGWRFLKRRYVRKLLDMKPEVADVR
jgi:hypothetical protein